MRDSTATNDLRGLKWCLAASFLGCCAVLYGFAWNMYPVPDGDAMFFVPAIRSYAVEGRVENKALDMSFVTDPEGRGRYLFYPPVFMVTVGGVARCLGVTGYPGILLLLATVRVASVAVFTVVIHGLVRRRYLATIPAQVIVVAVAMVVGNGLFLLASNGRPELLTLLLASIAIPISLSPSLCKDIFLPVLVACTFSFSIANGIIAFAIYALYLCIAQESCVRRVLQLTAAGTLMGVLFLGGYLLAGIEPRDGLAGIMLHSKIQLVRTDTSIGLLVTYWKSWFLFCAVACVVFGVWLRRRLASPSSTCTRVQAAGAVLLFAATVLFFGVRAAPAHYNVYAFLPIYQAVAFAGFLALSPRTDPVGGGDPQVMCRGSAALRNACMGVLVLAACMACANTALRLLTFPYYLVSGCDYRSMKPVFARVLEEHPGTFFYSGDLQMLDDAMAGSIFRVDAQGRCTSLRAEHEGRATGRSIVFVQERNGYPVPPLLRRVVLDATDKGPAPSPTRVLRVLRLRQGYSFTAYEQEPLEPLVVDHP